MIQIGAEFRVSAWGGRVNFCGCRGGWFEGVVLVEPVLANLFEHFLHSTNALLRTPLIPPLFLEHFLPMPRKELRIRQIVPALRLDQPRPVMRQQLCLGAAS